MCWQLWPGPAEDAEDLLSVWRSDLAVDLRLLLLPQLLLHLGQHLLHPLDLWSKKPRATMKGLCKHRHIYVRIYICCIRRTRGTEPRAVMKWQWAYLCYDRHLLHPLDLSSKANSNDERAVQAQAYLCYDQHLLHLLDLWCKARSNDEMAVGVFMLSSTSAASIGSVVQKASSNDERAMQAQAYLCYDQHLLHLLDLRCKAMSNDEMAADVFMLSSTSAASIGSVKQSHEQ